MSEKRTPLSMSDVLRADRAARQQATRARLFGEPEQPEAEQPSEDEHEEREAKDS
jgi:hypothetical protein